MHGSTKNNTVKYYQKFWCAMLAVVTLIGNMLCGGAPKSFTAYAAAGDVAISAANFPDDNFRAWVSSGVSHADTTTVNGSGSNEIGTITQAEFEAIQTITLVSTSISDLQGIEYFTKLTGLTCEESLLSHLDISKNTALTSLQCDGNSLSSLDVSKNTALTDLRCQSNLLTTLDVSNNTLLDNLMCNSNQLTNLDLSKNTNLEYLVCYANNLESLDLSNNKLLNVLNCRSNNLTNLNLGDKAKLGNLTCQSQTTTASVHKNVTNTTTKNVDTGETTTEQVTYQVYMSDLVASSDIGNVSLPDNSDWIYDEKSGIMTYGGSDVPTTLVYDYDTGIMLNDSEQFMDVTATLSLYSPTVTFYPNNGEGSFKGTIDSTTNKVSAPTDPTRTNYKFLGWYTSTDGGQTLSSDPFDFSTTITTDTNLYAKWDSVPTVTFYPNNGEDSFKGTIDSTTNKVSAQTDPTRTYFKFLGWYTSTDGGQTLSSDPFDFSTAITTDTNLYAKWMCWIEFPEVGAIVTANDGGMFSGYLDKGYTLHADLIGEGSEDYSALHSQLVNATDSGLDNSEIFDIYFTDESSNRADAKDFGENIEVYLKKPDSWDFGSMKAFYITPESAMECALTDTEMNGTSYVHLTTTHFSDYAIVTTGAASSPTASTTAVATGDNSLAGVLILCSILLCAGLTLLILKKKKASCR